MSRDASEEASPTVVVTDTLMVVPGGGAAANEEQGGVASPAGDMQCVSTPAGQLLARFDTCAATPPDASAAVATHRNVAPRGPFLRVPSALAAHATDASAERDADFSSPLSFTTMTTFAGNHHHSDTRPLQLALPPTPAKQRRTVHHGSVTRSRLASAKRQPSLTGGGSAMRVRLPAGETVVAMATRVTGGSTSRKRSVEAISQFSAIDLNDTNNNADSLSPQSLFAPFGDTATTAMARAGGNNNSVASPPSGMTAMAGPAGLLLPRPLFPSHPTTAQGDAAGQRATSARALCTPLSQMIDQRQGSTCWGNNNNNTTVAAAELNPQRYRRLTAPAGGGGGALGDPLDGSQADASSFFARRILTDYREVRELGSGSFGKVTLYEEISTGELVAVKVSEPLMSTVQERQWRREQFVLGLVRGMPHVIQLSAAWEEGRVPQIYLQLEYCPGGSLAAEAERRRRSSTPWDESEILVLLSQMAIALDALHRSNIAHVDFKPDNILIDASGDYKLSDFGCSVVLNEAGRPMTHVCCRRQPQGARGATSSEAFCSPSKLYGGDAANGGGGGALENTQVSLASADEGDCRYLCSDMLNQKVNFKAGDMFALGMSLYELLSGEPLPRGGEGFVALRQHVPTEQLRERGYSPRLAQLVRALLADDPAARPSARQVLYFLRPAPELLPLLADERALAMCTASLEALEKAVQGGSVTLAQLRCLRATTAATARLLDTVMQSQYCAGKAGQQRAGGGGDKAVARTVSEQLQQQQQGGEAPLFGLVASPSATREVCTPVSGSYTTHWDAS